VSSSIRPTATHDDRAAALARLFEAVRDSLYVGVLAPEPHRDATLAANAALRALFGYAAAAPDSEVLPFAPARFVDPAARATLMERLGRDGHVTRELLRLRRTDHADLSVEVTARAERMGDGRLRVEALVREATAEAAVPPQAHVSPRDHAPSEPAGSIGITISGVAHELNNPLATIISWSERLSERPLDPLSRRGIAIIMGEAQRATRIVRNLLTFGRQRHTTRSRVDVNDLVRETLALRSRDGAQITAVTDLAPGLPDLFVDGHQIQQVLLNLVTNAEQAMASSGGETLLLRTRFDAARGMVVLEVRDSGPGIAPDVRERIFDPFFTTKGPGEGTGLGLTVALGLVREHGGRIRVESEPGRGTSFLVDLPAVGGAEGPGAAAADLPPHGRASVLLVEDEQGLAAATMDALAGAGLNVDHASDGEEALARVRQSAYDLVICDLQMPRVNGMVLYRAMAAATPALARRVIFVTGDVGGAETERFLDESGCRWVAKPFRFADLLRAVRETLA
jgi:signal transduction histidine kinase/BarA-like signal transduction histidine kinase